MLIRTSKKLKKINKKISKKYGGRQLLESVLNNFKEGNVAIHNMNNTILIVNYGLNRIEILDMQYNYIGSFGENDDGNKNLHHPRSIAVDQNSGNIIVCDTGSSRIQIFDRNGIYIRTIRECDGVPFHFPKEVSVASNGDILISDQENNRICCFHRDGGHYFTLGEYDSPAIKFNHPYGLTVGFIQGIERIVVCDSHNSKIAIFELDGEFSILIDTSEDDINTLVSIAVDNNSRIHCIELKTPNLIYIYTGSGEIEIQQLNAPKSITPRKITIDKNTGNIYISDTRHNRIALFDSNYNFIRFILDIEIIDNYADGEDGWRYEPMVNNSGIITGYMAHRNPSDYSLDTYNGYGGKYRKHYLQNRQK